VGSPFEFKLQGLPELRRTFQGLRDDVKKRLLRKAAKKAGERYLDRAKELVPRGRTRRLHDSLHVVIRKSGFLRLTALVANTNDTFYGLFVEFGHKIGNRATGRLNTGRRNEKAGSGRVAEKPFMRPAFDTRTGAAISGANFEFAKGIKKAALKGKRK